MKQNKWDQVVNRPLGFLVSENSQSFVLQSRPVAPTEQSRISVEPLQSQSDNY